MKEGKNFRIWGVRFGLGGDLCMALPILNYLELKYPNSYRYWIISKKCSQFAPLFFNHPLIDCIRITELLEDLGPRDIEIAKSCDLIFNVAPQHPPCPGLTVGIDNFWYNHYSCVQETWKMAGLKIEDFYNLPKELQKPKLNVWFDVEKFPKTLAIWNYAAYGREPKRSPSKEYWEKLYNLIIGETEFKIFRFGHPSEPYIQENNFIKDLRHLSFLEQVKLSVGCSVSITTNSGSGWVLGAYGVKQITLLTNDAPNHVSNLLAFQPENWAGNNISLLNSSSCDLIPQTDVLAAINQLK